MTINSPDYLNSTEYDHERWAISQNAQQKLEIFQSGLDIEDIDLTSSDLAIRYPANTREVKATAFSKQDADDQLEIVIAAVAGKKSKVIEQKKVDSTAYLVIRRINSYLMKLKAAGELKLWIQKSCDPAIVANFPLDEKIKYHDALIKYYNDVSGQAKVGSNAFPAEANPVALNLEDGNWKEICQK